jgi:hypothetical protein
VLSQLVGSAISWASEAVLSLGLATPWIVEQVSTRVASWTAKVGSKMTALVRSVKALSKLLDELRGLLRQADDLFASVLTGGKKAVNPAREAAVEPVDVSRFDPRRTDLISNMQKWADEAGIPGYKPFGNLGGEEFLDTHLKGFNERGFADWNWPQEAGFDTSRPITPASTAIQPGDVIDRLSPQPPEMDTGQFASPLGTPFPSQSLPPDRLAPDFQHYQLEVVKPLPPEVRAGWIAKGFQQDGGGVQYYFPGGISKWIEAGYLRPLRID